DGVYRSDDGGKSWKNMGLKASEHVGQISIDPRDSNVVYVAAQGPLWGPGGERGLFKTTDGGKTWKAVLTVSENTGVTDVAIDPNNPDTLYAAAHQRRRRIYVPNVLMMVSDDGGRTLRPLGERSKHVDNHVIWIDPTNPNRYLVGCDGGLYESFDRGATWDFKANLPIPQFYDVTTDNATP